MTDVLVVGAGPAGISTALWCQSLGLGVHVLEAAGHAGGQLHWIYAAVQNYAGLRGTGAELATALEAHARDVGLEVRCGEQAIALDALHAEVALQSGERRRGRSVIVATGTRRRELGVPGESKLLGRGVSTSATRDRSEFAGRRVLVVGGGDAAFENALLLAEVGCDVAVVVRGAEPRARADFRRRVAASPRIEVLSRTGVEAVLGEERVEGVRLSGPGGVYEREAAAVVVKVGMVPNTEWCRAALELDAEGYPRLGEGLRTSRPRVLAVGDLTRPALPSLAHAVGSGARAAAEIFRELGR